ncbi:hypothetical protein [uncultured Rikenella sp.]|uniref:hypothetical protein n=1 Tax=uncultured Rikenella sp. TaxID=368003 RepID=UPI0025DEA638|nr:hypothetical protein [uncultured Rikenella sp.]
MNFSTGNGKDRQVRIINSLTKIKSTRAFKLTAKRTLGKIPKGFVIQVPSQSLSAPTALEVEKAIIRAGFDDSLSRGYQASGNWIVEKLG